MDEKLLEIQPSQLNFVFELKKRILCTVSLVNNTDQYVAFKVKTTSPNKYYVRPNVSIVRPKSTCDLTIIMEAQWVSPPGMKCKDKFLIQSTIVFSGTKEEEITSSLFTKDNGRYIEESKLRVVLLSRSHSPVAMDMKILKDVQELKQDVEELNITKDVGDGRVAEAEGESKLARDIEELKLKLRKVEAKLNEDESIVTRLREDRRIAATESQKLIPEPAILETQIGRKEIQVDFLFLFVCVMALISLELGFQLLGS